MMFIEFKIITRFISLLPLLLVDLLHRAQLLRLNISWFYIGFALVLFDPLPHLGVQLGEEGPEPEPPGGGDAVQLAGAAGVETTRLKIRKIFIFISRFLPFFIDFCFMIL